MQSNGRVKQSRAQITVYNQSRDPETWCVLIPLGSPTTVPKRVLTVSPRGAVRECVLSGAVPGWVPGGYTGWVTRVAIPGTQPRGRPLRKRSRYQRSGPRKPQRGLEWVGICIAPQDVRHPPLRGPVSPAGFPGASSSKCPLLANNGEI